MLILALVTVIGTRIRLSKMWRACLVCSFSSWVAFPTRKWELPTKCLLPIRTGKLSSVCCLFLVRISRLGSVNNVCLARRQVQPTSWLRKASSTIWNCWVMEINRYQRERHRVAEWFSDGSTPLSITPFRVSICSILMLYCYLFMVSARHFHCSYFCS